MAEARDRSPGRLDVVPRAMESRWRWAGDQNGSSYPDCSIRPLNLLALPSVSYHFRAQRICHRLTIGVYYRHIGS